MDEKTLEYMWERVEEGKLLKKTIAGLNSFKQKLSEEPALVIGVGSFKNSSSMCRVIGNIEGLNNVFVKERFSEAVVGVVDELIAEFEEKFQKL